MNRSKYCTYVLNHLEIQISDIHIKSNIKSDLIFARVQRTLNQGNVAIRENILCPNGQYINQVKEQGMKNKIIQPIIYKGHTEEVISIDQDDLNVLTGSLDNSAKLFSKDGHLIRTFYGHKAPLTTVALSKYLVITGAEDGQVIIQGRQSGNSLIRIRHESKLSSIKIQYYDQKQSKQSKEQTNKDYEDDNYRGNQKDNQDYQSKYNHEDDKNMFDCKMSDKCGQVLIVTATEKGQLRIYKTNVYNNQLSSKDKIISNDYQDSDNEKQQENDIDQENDKYKVIKSDVKLIKIYKYHNDKINTVLINNEFYLYSGSSDNTVTRKNISDDSLTQVQQQDQKVNSIIVNNNLLIAGLDNGHIDIRDKISGIRIKQIHGHTSSITSLDMIKDVGFWGMFKKIMKISCQD